MLRELLQSLSAESASSPWVSCGKHTLNIADKMIIKSGGELTDKHVQMAQYLILLPP